MKCKVIDSCAIDNKKLDRFPIEDFEDVYKRSVREQWQFPKFNQDFKNNKLTHDRYMSAKYKCKCLKFEDFDGHLVCDFDGHDWTQDEVDLFIGTNRHIKYWWYSTSGGLVTISKANFSMVETATEAACCEIDTSEYVVSFNNLPQGAELDKRNFKLSQKRIFGVCHKVNENWKDSLIVNVSNIKYDNEGRVLFTGKTAPDKNSYSALPLCKGVVEKLVEIQQIEGGSWDKQCREGLFMWAPFFNYSQSLIEKTFPRKNGWDNISSKRDRCNWISDKRSYDVDKFGKAFTLMKGSGLMLDNRECIEPGNCYIVPEGSGKTYIFYSNNIDRKVAFVTSRVGLVEEFREKVEKYGTNWKIVDKEHAFNDGDNVYMTAQYLSKNRRLIDDLHKSGYLICCDEIHTWLDFMDTKNLIKNLQPQLTCCFTASNNETLRWHLRDQFHFIEVSLEKRKKRKVEVNLINTGGMTKTNAIKETIKQAIDLTKGRNERSIVYINDKEFNSKIYDELSDDIKRYCAVYQSEASLEDESRYIEKHRASNVLKEFKEKEEARVLITTAKCGVGIDLHNRVNNFFLVCDNPFEISQVVNRERDNDLKVYIFRHLFHDTKWMVHDCDMVDIVNIGTELLEDDMSYTANYWYKNSPEVFYTNLQCLLKKNFDIIGEPVKNIFVPKKIETTTDARRSKWKRLLAEYKEGLISEKTNLLLSEYYKGEEWHMDNDKNILKNLKLVYSDEKDELKSALNAAVKRCGDEISSTRFDELMKEFNKLAYDIAHKHCSGRAIWNSEFNNNWKKVGNVWVKRYEKKTERKKRETKMCKFVDENDEMTVKEYCEKHQCSVSTALRHKVH